MNKILTYVLIALIALGIGIGGTCYFLNNPTKGTNDTSKTVNQNKNSKDNNISEEDVKNKLYPLLASSDQSRVYGSSKITVSNLTTDKIILGVISYIALNNDNDIKKTNDLYSINIDTINKYAKVLYGTEVGADKLPEHISPIYNQGTLVDYDKKTKSYVFNLEFYDQSTTPHKIVNQYAYKEDGVAYGNYEVKDDVVYVYSSIILNANIDWNNTGYGTIQKYDGSGLIEFKDDDYAELNDLIRKYPDYFTEYRHTFKINADGTYKYISTEAMV